MKVIKNIIRVVMGNITTIISGIFVGFILPKIISVYDYGFYKIFTLYFNYIGVLSLGIIDGIVLKYGGCNYGELDRSRFRGYFAWYSIVNGFFSAVLLITAAFVPHVDYKFVLLLLCANVLPINITGYLQQISQITQRFKEYSTVKVIQSGANVVLVLAMLLLYKMDVDNVNYKMYLVGLLAINLILAIWYMSAYKDIILGSRANLKETFNELKQLVKIGFPLLLANLCSTLILSLDRQFVSVLFDTEEYAVYAFAYSMLSLITVATSAISTVIYPLFKRVELSVLKENYRHIKAIILVFSFIVTMVYFPLCYFIEWYLPLYAYSLSIFRIILPGLVISTAITVVIHNYYKVLGMSTGFFKLSLVALAISFAFNTGAYMISGTREMISIVSVAALLLWYIAADTILRRHCGSDFKNLVYLVVTSASFYLCTEIKTYWVGGLIYIAVFGVVTVMLYGRDVRKIKNLIKS